MSHQHAQSLAELLPKLLHLSAAQADPAVVHELEHLPIMSALIKRHIGHLWDLATLLGATVPQRAADDPLPIGIGTQNGGVENEIASLPLESPARVLLMDLVELQREFHQRSLNWVLLTPPRNV